MSDTLNGTIKLPLAWLKPLATLLAAALLGGSGGSWLSSERLVKIEVKVETLERESQNRLDWMKSLTDRIRELERGGGTE